MSFECGEFDAYCETEHRDEVEAQACAKRYETKIANCLHDWSWTSDGISCLECVAELNKEARQGKEARG